LSVPGDRNRGVSVMRLPAQEIEDLVFSHLTKLVESRQTMMGLVGNSAQPAQLQRAMEALDRFAVGLREKLPTIFQSAVAGVVVYEDRVEIEVNKQALTQQIWGRGTEFLTAPDSEADTLMLATATTLKRCGCEVRLALPPDSGAGKPHHERALLQAVARAHDWLAANLRGDFANQRSIVEQTGLDYRYVSRIFPLAFLAPDLTEAILEGTQPAHLSLERLRGNTSLDWARQRSILGVPGLKCAIE